MILLSLHTVRSQPLLRTQWVSDESLWVEGIERDRKVTVRNLGCMLVCP